MVWLQVPKIGHLETVFMVSEKRLWGQEGHGQIVLVNEDILKMVNPKVSRRPFRGSSQWTCEASTYTIIERALGKRSTDIQPISV